jgi:poly-gamma-glutamate synthesis protein (capsule biosynthesis protein)
VTLNAVGDLMLERDIIGLMQQNGAVFPFASVKDQLAAADITVANMEGTFTDRGDQASKFYTFRTPPRFAAGLKEAGIDVVALGNNHTMDFGDVGLGDTLDALDAAGVPYSGAGSNEEEARKPVILEAQGLRLAFFSYNAVLESTFAASASPGVARATAGNIAADVAAAKPNVDLVIVSIHGGTEYSDTPTAEQRSLAHAAIDAGATLVLGSHPHVLQGSERYGNGFIIYSLGNFVFDLDFDDLATLGPRPFQTMILQIELSKNGVESVSHVPVYIDPAENRPIIASGETASQVEDRIEQLNAGLR